MHMPQYQNHRSHIQTLCSSICHNNDVIAAANPGLYGTLLAFSNMTLASQTDYAELPDTPLQRGLSYFDACLEAREAMGGFTLYEAWTGIQEGHWGVTGDAWFRWLHAELTGEDSEDYSEDDTTYEELLAAWQSHGLDVDEP